MIKAIRNFFAKQVPAEISADVVESEPEKPVRVASRSFSAAQSSRLNMDWITSPLSADNAIKNDLRTLRNRSRDLEKNNEWAAGYYLRMENQILGEKGIKLCMRITDPSGKADEYANDRIESEWLQWCRPENCTVDGSTSFREVEAICLRSVLRDGGVMVRKVYDSGNPWGFALQLIEMDYLDHDYTTTADNGNQIRMGVEMNGYRKPVAYHLLTRHPGDIETVAARARYRIRVPADEICHLYQRKRVEQTIGYPELAPAMKGLRMLDGYKEAELVAARTSAAKMGFFTKTNPDGYQVPVDEDGKEVADGLNMDASPGTIEELPLGVDFKAWDPTHPTQAFGDFLKSALRGVATSQGMSYNTMTGDLENVSFSSIRAGLLEERELFKCLQRFLIDHLHTWVFEAWLMSSLLVGKIGLPSSKFFKFNQPEFRGRRWPWVDPAKDIKAVTESVGFGIMSRREAIANTGGDIFDVFREQQADNELADQYNLSFTSSTEGAATLDENGDPIESADDAAASGDIQQTALNGAQVTALADLVTQVSQGLLPASSAMAIAKAAFPLIPDATISAIFKNVQGFAKPKEAPKPANLTPE